MILDTHEFVENLVASGVKKKQAEVIVKEINKSEGYLATKTDILEAKYDILKCLVPILMMIVLLIVGLWLK